HVFIPVSASPRNVIMLPDGRPPIDSSNAPIPLLMFAIFFSTPGTVSVDPACSGTGPGTLAGILLGRVLIVPLEPLVPLPLPLGILGCYLSRLLRSSCYRRLRRFLPLLLWRRLRPWLTLRTPTGPLMTMPSGPMAKA